jgi:hypothetical protein
MTTMISKERLNRKLTPEEEAANRAMMDRLIKPAGTYKEPEHAPALRSRGKNESGDAYNKYLDQARASAEAAGQYDDREYNYVNKPLGGMIGATMGGNPKFLSGMANFECPPGAKCASPGNSAFGHAQGNGVMGGAFGQFHMNNSAGVVARALQGLRDTGVPGMQEAAKKAASQSMMSKFMDGPMIKPEDDIPVGPGFAMLNHLFRNAGGGDKIRKKAKDQMLGGLGIMTNAMDGVRTALKMIGVQDDNNLDGLPVDMKDVFKIFHGEKADEMDDIQKNDFMRDITDGSKKIDKKKIRKFVNQDGSLTWEILNDDMKTIMSRFTFGEYNGTKLFAQGGYKNFGQLLREAREKLGPDYRGEFDSIRKGY